MHNPIPPLRECYAFAPAKRCSKFAVKCISVGGIGTGLVQAAAPMLGVTASTSGAGLVPVKCRQCAINAGPC